MNNRGVLEINEILISVKNKNTLCFSKFKFIYLHINNDIIILPKIYISTYAKVSHVLIYTIYLQFFI